MIILVSKLHNVLYKRTTSYITILRLRVPSIGVKRSYTRKANIVPIILEELNRFWSKHIVTWLEICNNQFRVKSSQASSLQVEKR